MDSPPKGRGNIRKTNTPKMSEDASNSRLKPQTSSSSRYSGRKGPVTPTIKSSGRKERTPIYIDPQRNEGKTPRPSKVSRGDYTIMDDPFKNKIRASLNSNFPSSVLSCKHASHFYDGCCSHPNKNEVSAARGCIMRPVVENRPHGHTSLRKNKEQNPGSVGHSHKYLHKENPIIPDFVDRQLPITFKIDEGVQVLLKTTQTMVDKGENTILPFQYAPKKNSDAHEPLDVDDPICVYRESICVKINNLLVPQITKHGAPVVLDCDFSLEAVGDDELVVKWYKNATLVYQWIPAMNKRPQDLGVLKGKLNLAYAASVDAHSIHRALHILKPGPDLSGDYTCSVSTLKNEDQKTKTMLVFVPEKNLMLRRKLVTEEVMKVTCKAEGVFPEPSMVLRSQEREVTETEVNVRKKGELYDITAVAVLPSLEGPEEFSCELRIPEANYTKRQETVFFPGQDSKGNFVLSSLNWLPLLTIPYIYFSTC